MRHLRNAPPWLLLIQRGTAPMSDRSSELRLAEARQAIADRNWPAACDAFAGCGPPEGLSGDDLAVYADAHWWMGRIETSLELSRLAYRTYLREDRPRRAAFIAFVIGFIHAMRCEEGAANGWIGRAYRLLEDDPDCAEYGYLLYVEADGLLAAGALEDALERAHAIMRLGRTFSDSALMALGTLAEGRVLVCQGDVRSGMIRFDEAMVAAESDELDPSWTGNIYCTLIAACQELGEYQRAAEWTLVSMRWCEQQAGPGPFLGICRAHRSQFLQLQGDWMNAEDQARKVCTTMVGFDSRTVAEAWYQIGEIERKRGNLASAEAAYLESHRFGRDPQPGFALLRLAQHRPNDATVGLEAAVAAHAGRPLSLAPLLAAQVNVAAATGDAASARLAADELGAISDRFSSSGLGALAAEAKGIALLTEHRLAEALHALRDACTRWQALGAPYETSLVRLSMAMAYEGLADPDAALRERNEAERMLRHLGATLDRPVPGTVESEPSSHPLTDREAQVLGLVAAGKTNREIGDELFISSKTVSRHLENIYAKLGVSSRAAASAYAVEHKLTDRQRGSITP